MTFLWLLFWAVAGAPNPAGGSRAWLLTLILCAWFEVVGGKRGRS